MVSTLLSPCSTLVKLSYESSSLLGRDALFWWSATAPDDVPITASNSETSILPADGIEADNDKREPIHIVYSANIDSMAGVEASIRSVRAHSSGPIQFYVIGYQPLVSMPNVHWFNLTDIVSTYSLHEFMNIAEDGRDDDINRMESNYARFALDSLLLNRTDKVLYLDADTIVLCDAYSLVNSVLLGDRSSRTHAIAAVPRKRRRGETTPIRGLTEHGVEALGRKARKGKSFNAGVYVISLKLWRQHNLTERIRRIALRNRRDGIYKGGSQPPMNIVIGDKFESLPESWNIGTGDYEKRKAKKNSTKQTCLIHYKGGIRPWARGSQHGGRDEWLRYGVAVNMPNTSTSM